MKKYLSLLFVLLLVGCTGKTAAPEKIYQVQLMYNGSIGYSWYLKNPQNLKMTKLISEEKKAGAFEPTKLGNPYTQTFTFKLINPSIKQEKVTFEYKHYIEKDQPHSEGVKTFDLKASDFK